MTAPNPDKWAFIVNPNAGGGRAMSVWRELLTRHRWVGASHSVIESNLVESANGIDRMLNTGMKKIVVIGGDGSMHLLANRVMHAGKADEVSIGLIPGGTGSDLSRSLELSGNPHELLTDLYTKPPVRIDAVEVAVANKDKRYAINITSAGLSGVVASAIQGRAQYGKFSYLRHSIQALLGYKSCRGTVWVDGEQIHNDEFYLMAVANGQYFGNGMRVAPMADTTSGHLELIILPPQKWWRLPYRMVLFMTGKHMNVAGVKHRQAQSVRLEPELPFPLLELDGEVMTPGPVDYRVVPGALSILGSAKSTA